MSKSLGQTAEAAYEAALEEEYRLAGLHGLHLVGEEASRALDKAWEAAAEAVVDQFVSERATTFSARLAAEQAVIEAAKSVLAECERGIHQIITDDWDNGFMVAIRVIEPLLRPSLETLQEALWTNDIEERKIKHD